MMLRPDTVMEVNNIGKIFTRNEHDARLKFLNYLKSTLFPRVQQRNTSHLRESEFWSLNSVNFELKKGQALGIIGLNGSGKTTLLRILAGQISPDAGQILHTGRTASVIDLTSGFDFSASGRENIFIRTSMLGWSQKYTLQKLQEIIDFSELEEVIDSPISKYSSGMVLRLAFSIMLFAHADIFLVDEVLSVGDFIFRQKCLSKIRELRQEASFVLASHSMSDIRNFCDNVIFLDRGRVVNIGQPSEIIPEYEKCLTLSNRKKNIKVKDFRGVSMNNDEALTLGSVYWTNSAEQKLKVYGQLDSLCLNVEFFLHYTPRNLYVGIPIWNEAGTLVTGLSTPRSGCGINAKKGDAVQIKFNVEKLNLNPGRYLANLAIHDGPEFLYRGEIDSFEVSAAEGDHWGIVNLDCSWEIDVDTR